MAARRVCILLGRGFVVHSPVDVQRTLFGTSVTVVVAHVAAQRVDAVMLIGFILVLAIIAGS